MQSHYQIKTLAEKLINKHFFFDSRICTKNSVFVALETGNRSGMEFIQNAISNGADCVISQQPINIDGIENIVVPDSLEFIQNLAKEKFKILQNRGIKTVCLTGSAGKTTTKELIANTLMQYGTVYATQGNYNNHIGVPMTILNCPTNVDFLVLEMGMNHAGEIAKLVEIAPCDFRLITNVGNAHTANFHNGITGVLHAKFEILQNGNPKVFILEGLYNKFLLDKTLQGMYGSSDISVVKPDFAKFYENETTKFAFKGMNFALAGIYSDSQIAMFCLAIELISSVIGKKIKQIVLPELKGRSNVVLWRNIKIINDSYNANPLSMVNSLENLKQYQGKKLCILGEMRELGSDSKALHKNLEGILGAFAGVYLIGNNFGDVKPDVNELQFFENYLKLKEFLLSNVENVLTYDVILVKGSNGVLLWKLFDEVFA
jgi:UDP-N-acetylmuramoyl-tripeptide--D-alanyl-D-alanine ligase